MIQWEVMQLLHSVIWDFDGTIVDTMPICVEAFRLAIEPLTGKRLSDEEIMAVFGPTEEGTVRLLVPPDREKEALEGYLHHYRILQQSRTTPFAGIRELLDAMIEQGILLGLVTGKGPGSLQIGLEALEMEDLFHAVETGSPEGPNKPVGIRKILSRFSIAPEEAVYIGDAPTDITACREVGIPILSAAWAPDVDRDRLRGENPAGYCATVSQLLLKLGDMGLHT